DRGLSIEVVVGEEVTTLGGHLLALWIEKPVKPFRSMRSTIAAIHDQGGLAIPAHPLVPYPLCAQGFMLRRLLGAEPRFRPDATGRDATWATRASSPIDRTRHREDRAGHAVRVSAAGGREPARPVPVREPAPARSRRPHPDQLPRPAASLRGRRHPHRQGLLD